MRRNNWAIRRYQMVKENDKVTRMEVDVLTKKIFSEAVKLKFNGTM